MRGGDSLLTLTRRYLGFTRDMARSIGDGDLDTARQILGERGALQRLIGDKLTCLRRGEHVDSRTLQGIEDVLTEAGDLDCEVRRILTRRQENILQDMRLSVTSMERVGQHRPPVALDLRA